MKFNLKNRPTESKRSTPNHYEWHEWFEGFKKELREIYESVDFSYITAKSLIKEILGE